VETREKIIVGLLCGSILYGLASLVFFPGERKPLFVSEKELTELKSLAGILSEDLDKGAIKDSERRILELTDMPWGADPFVGKKLAVVASKGKERREMVFAYTGYIDSGGKKLAIVNGLEYESGDELRPGGYFMVAIDESQVILREKGKEEAIVVPFTGNSVRE
jgi:hypothetical protein